MIDIEGNIIPNYVSNKPRRINMYTIYVNGNPYGNCYISDIPILYRQLKEGTVVSEGFTIDHTTQSAYLR